MRKSYGVKRSTNLLLAAAALILPMLFARAARAQTYSIVYNFDGGADGSNPQAGVIHDPSENLYGTAYGGGNFNGTCYTYGCGVIFKLDPVGKETVLYTFTGGSDGANPTAGLIRDSAGNLYGTTAGGGNVSGACAPFGCGLVFKLDPAGHETVLYTFTGGPEGSYPTSLVWDAAAGNLYGTTVHGGNLEGSCSLFGCGAVFRLDAGGHETTLYSFTGGADGGNAYGGVVRDAAGNLYGTAYVGGSKAGSCSEYGCGVVFRIDPAGTETVLHAFGGAPDGSAPYAGLVRDSAGNLYGTTSEGGITGGVCGEYGCGAAFRLDSAGGETVLHAFAGGSDGGNPRSALVRDPAGNLYGTALYGGANGYGAVFKLSPIGKETVLYSFSGASGESPQSALLPYKGELYGTAQQGGVHGYGVVFKVSFH